MSSADLLTLWVFPRFAAVPVQQLRFGEIAWLSRFPVRKRITLLVTSSSPRRPRSNETAVGDPIFLGLCASVAAAENAAKLPFYYWSRAETSFLCTTMPAAATTQSQLE